MSLRNLYLAYRHSFRSGRGLIMFFRYLRWYMILDKRNASFPSEPE